MIILFSPSEAKTKGGEKRAFGKESFIFPKLFDKRVEVLNIYNDYIKTASKEKLSKLFGLKDENEIEYYKIDLFERESKKAIERYAGVAFKYLNYSNLSKEAKRYIDKNVLIFSNLFGPISAKDEIIDYKLKQGEKIENFSTDKFYKKYFSQVLDEYIEENSPILDLRANFYEKFYKIKADFYTMKFIKNNKVVSHFAKAYRGIILREMAKAKVESIEDLRELQIKNLSIKEIIKTKNKTEFICEIKE